jgi:hypothetical protein
MKMKLLTIISVLILFILNGCEKQTSPVQSTPITSAIEIKNMTTRAVGESLLGKLLIVPTTLESIDKLGAPSCLGLEEDYSIKATYSVIFETKKKSQIISTFHNLEIINPSTAVLPINKVVMDGMELFYFIPRYTDCHEQELYFFGVKDNEAYPITVEMEENNPITLGIYPKTLPRLIDGELIVKGGYSAGMDYISEYHFKLNTDKKLLKLAKTIHLKPN